MGTLVEFIFGERVRLGPKITKCVVPRAWVIIFERLQAGSSFDLMVDISIQTRRISDRTKMAGGIGMTFDMRLGGRRSQ